VIVWGDRIAREPGAAAALLDVAGALDLSGTEGSGLLEIPDFANARGTREAGCLPDAGPGLTRLLSPSDNGGQSRSVGMPTEEIRAALISGELTGLLLFGADPLRDFPDTPAWQEALTAADFVVSFSMHENATTAKADVVLPLETHAEKDGTVTHPDGRLQRVRPSSGRPGDIRPNVLVLSQLAENLGLVTGIDSQPTAFAALTEAVSFYNGITDEQIGGRGIRWQDTPAATNTPEPGRAPAPGSPDPPRSLSADPGAGAPHAHALTLGTYRDLWAGPITELNPPLKFLTPQQRIEISTADADRLGLKSGDRVRVSHNGAGVDAEVHVKERVPAGVVFMAEGILDGNANALLNGGPVSVQIEKLSEVRA
jgi:NADH-quinone oxidoreductase subunit G